MNVTEVTGQNLYALKEIKSNPGENDFYKLSTWTRASDVKMSNGDNLQDTLDHLDSEFSSALDAYSEISDYGPQIDPSDSFTDVMNAIKTMEAPILTHLSGITGEDVTNLQTVNSINSYLQSKYNQIVSAVSACGVTIPAGSTINEIAELFLEAEST